MSGVFAICESKRQVEWLLSRPTLSATVTHLLAANPAAAWALQKRGVAYPSLEDYQQSTSVEQVERLQAEQIQWAHRVDAFLQGAIAPFKAMDFRPARYYLYYLKNAWDTFIHRASLLEQLATHARPAEVLFFANETPIRFDQDLTVQASALAALIPDWARHYGIVHRALPILKGDTFWKLRYYMPGGIKGVLLRLLPSSVYRAALKIYRRQGISPTFVGHSLSAMQLKVIIRQHYDLTQDVCDQLRGLGIGLLSFEDMLAEAQKLASPIPEIEIALEDAWEKVIAQDDFWQPGGGQDWSIRSALEPLFQHFWFQVIPALWRSMTGAIAMIDRQRPKAVVVSVVWGPGETGLIMAARMAQVPVIFYMHGANIGDIENTIWDVVDRYWSDYMLVYGLGEVKYIRTRPQYGDKNATPLAVGSARLDAVQRKERLELVRSLRRRIVGASRSPLILYVPGSLFNNYFRYDFYDIRSTRVFEIRKQMAKLFDEHPEVHFVYKAFMSQGDDPTLEMFSSLCPRCKIIGDIPLTDLQWAADALIHEIPSTGMHEGLLTDKPMIVYADRDIYRMPHEVREMLGRRVVLAQSGQEFVQSVESLLAQANYAAISNPDQEFLRTYFTYLDDGQSAGRAAQAIYQIATGELRPN